MLRVLTDYAKEKGLVSSELTHQMRYMFVYALQRAVYVAVSLGWTGFTIVRFW